MGTISEKLVYLNGTKQAIKQAINEDFEVIDNNTTFREYADEISSNNAKYKDLIPKETKNATNTLDISNSSGLDKALVTLYGNTYQETTAGKNLLGLLPNQSVEVNGVTISTTEEGYLKLNGTATANINKNYNWLVKSSTYTSQQYTYSITYVSGTLSNSFIINIRSGSTTTDMSNQFTPSMYLNANDNSTTFTPSGSGYITGIQIIASSGCVFNNFIVKMQIEKGTVTSYEEYTGGNPAPNPDYPQEIQVVSGDNTIKVDGKNLFDISTITENTYIDDTGNTGSSRVSNLSDYIELKPNASYTLSYDYSTLLNSAPRDFVYYDENKTIISGITYSPINKTSTFTTPNNAKYLRFSYDKNSTNIQIESGSTATEYEPYKGQTYPISLDYTNLFKKQDISSDDLNKRLNQIGENYNENGYFISPFIKVDKDTQYTINYTPTAYTRICYFVSNNTNSFISKNDDTSSFTTPSTCQYLRFCNLIADIDNIRLEKGSTITNNYIELCKIGDYQDSIKKSSGKNLCNTVFELGGIDTTTGQNGSGNDRVRTKDYVKIQPNTTYTLSGVQGSRVVCFYNSSKAYLSYEVVGSQSTSGTFITPNDTSYIRWYIIQTNTNINEMLNEGTTALPYEPYGKVWYLNKQIGKRLLDGSEAWQSASSIATGTSRFYVDNSSVKYAGEYTKLILSNKFVSATWNEIYETDTTSKNLVASASSAGRIVIRIDNTYASSVADFKTWLRTNRPTVYYVLATPTTTEITKNNYPTLYNQLNNIKLYEGVNHITMTNESGLDVEFDITYYKDWKLD